ncbi:signal peptide protein [Streptomyces sp. NPDC050416]|uniref:signal peptide protein n=1 Tax=Streptomyces sp. NPDC050416 TaxID=3365611 RepID=UPI0037A376F0
MSLSKNSRLKVALLAALVAVTGLTTAGPAPAAPPAVTAAASVASQAQEPAVPTGFIDLPTGPLRPEGSQEVTLTYRHTTQTPTTVAPQLLLTSPDTGPFLSPSDVRVERRTGHGCWVPVRLGSQTGTLFTDLVGVRRTLGAGETLRERYRVTALNPKAGGTVEPRVALYG